MFIIGITPAEDVIISGKPCGARPPKLLCKENVKNHKMMF